MRRLALAGLALLAASLPLASQAQDAAGNASATVVRPLSTTALADLSFGSITAGHGTASGGTVLITPTGAVATYDGSVRPLCAASGPCQPHPARFAVSGEPGRAYRVTLPANVAARGSRTGTALMVEALALHSTNSASNSGGLLDASGRDSFAVGGTLLVVSGTPADAYRAEFAVTVSYD